MRSWALGFAALVVFAAPAAAQITDPAPASVGEVTVTARRAAEKALDVPISITRVDRSQIDALALNSSLDLNKVAGLGVVPIGSSANINFNLRGQGTAFGGQPGVITYFGEAPGFPLTFFDLADIQVIKGPQGTLFGQSSTGGVVLFEPAKPANRNTAFIDAQAGDLGYGQVDGALNLASADGALRGRFAFRVRERDGWGRANLTGGGSVATDNVDLRAFRASVTWTPRPGLEVYTVVARDETRSNGSTDILYYVDPRFLAPSVRNLVPANVPSLTAAWTFWSGAPPPAGQTVSALIQQAFAQQLAVGARTSFTDFDQRSVTINSGLINQVSWQATSDITFRNIFSLRWQTTQGGVYDIDGSGLPLDDVHCRYAVGATRAGDACAETGGWPARVLSEEAQLRGSSFGRRLQWQTGVFYLQSGIRSYRENATPYVVFGSLTGDPASAAFCSSVAVASPCSPLARSEAWSAAVYGQATLAPIERLHLTGGLRESWDYARTDTTGKASYLTPFQGQLIAMPVYGQAPAPGARVVSTTVDLPPNASYNLSADWRAADHTLLYLAHRSGYKPGGINAIAAAGAPQRTYGPERSKDLDLGIKSEFALGEMRASLTADYFHTWYSDIQEGQLIPGTAQTVTTNLARADIDGVELEGSLALGDVLRLTGSLAYTDARYADWTETSSCSAQFWRPQCAGLLGATAVSIDHAGGRLVIAGAETHFKPDMFANATPWRWSIRPELRLRRWLKEDVSLSIDVYHRGAYVDATAVANTSKLAGLTPLALPTPLGGTTADPYGAPGYTAADLRLDWRRLRGSRFSLSGVVTNVTNATYRLSSGSAFELLGSVYSVVGEPRTAYIQLRYDF